MKRCKFNFFTAYDGTTYVNKAHMVEYVKSLKWWNLRKLNSLMKELKKCEANNVRRFDNPER
jgi:hypothetical protein